MKAKILAAALVTFFGCSFAEALPSQSLPFGPNQIHWKMESASAVPKLSALAPKVLSSPGTSHTDQQSYFLGPYQWNSCEFRIRAFFAKHQLTQIWLDARPMTEECRAETRSELTSHFGKGEESSLAGGNPAKPCSPANPNGYATGSSTPDGETPSCTGPYKLAGSPVGPGTAGVGLDKYGNIITPFFDASALHAMINIHWAGKNTTVNYHSILGHTLSQLK